MRTQDELKQKLLVYGAAEYVYDPAVGYLVWHFSTGGNLEPLFVEAVEKGKGHGRRLYRMMVHKLTLSGDVPYHSVLAYRLGSNLMARDFYRKMGWTEQNLGRSIYRDDDTVIMWITWAALVKNLAEDHS